VLLFSLYGSTTTKISHGEKVYSNRRFNSSYTPDEYFSLLEKKKVEILKVNPGSLKTVLKEGRLFLEIENQKNDLFPVSNVFVEKLLRWFYTSTDILPYLSPDSVYSITNDLLSTIYKRGRQYQVNEVKIRIEDGVALSILGNNYVTIEDRDLYEYIKEFGVQKIVHDDHITRFITEIKIQKETVVGDRMGYSMHFTNSQTGFGAMTRSIFILRYWCKNGAVSSELAKKDFYYHNSGGLPGFASSLESFPTEFSEWVDNFEICLKEARNTKYDKKTSFRVKDLITRALPVYQTRDLIKFIEKADTIWQVYDTITTEAKKHTIYDRLLLEEVAGKVIMQFGGGIGFGGRDEE